MDARTPEAHLADTGMGSNRPMDDQPVIDLHRHIALFRRRLRLFLGIAVIVFLIVVSVTLTLKPMYTPPKRLIACLIWVMLLGTGSANPNR